MKNSIMSLFFPNKCPCCHKILLPENIFCNECFENFGLDKTPRCKVCFSPVSVCDCRRVPKFFKRSIAIYDYKGSIIKAILTFKKVYNNQLYLFFAEQMAKKIREDYSDIEFDAVIPVPLHKSALKKRGFNQSEILAKLIAEKLNLPVCCDSLLRVEKACSQHTLNYKQRKENVHDIYRCSGLDYNYRNILLVDDIMTSGATLNECSKMLVLDGAQKVFCVCIAKA